MIKNFLNPEGIKIQCVAKVTAILLKGWILSVGGASAGRVCACSLHSRVVLKYFNVFLKDSKMASFLRSLLGFTPKCCVVLSGYKSDF